jgi:hypothetical protein
VMAEEGEEGAALKLRGFDQRQMLADFVAGCRRKSQTEAAAASISSGSSSSDDLDEEGQEGGGLLGGVHRAMDLTLPGLLSEISAEQDSRWVQVPDSRNWQPQQTEGDNTSRL